MINNLRLQKILEILLETNKVATGEQLCSILGVSSRTIRSDIKELNNILEHKGAIISSEKSKGYKIEIFQENKFNEFLENINKKNDFNNSTIDGRAEYIIMRLLINEIKGIDGVTQLELAGTQIGNLVAIPHAMHEDIKESFISIAILKKPIDWNTEKVQLVLLIGMANNDKYKWKSYLEKVYRNIIDIEIVHEIIKCNNFEDLKKVISKF